MTMKLDSMLTVTLTLCALITTGALLHRELSTPKIPAEEGIRPPVYVKEWRTSQAGGLQMGSEGSPVQMLEFADFECPFCGKFHATLKNVVNKYPRVIGVKFVHFPIQGHRFAIPAARVAECANDQGRFAAMYDALFEGQDQFGLEPWDDYATAAGVADMAAFDACIKKSDPIPRVEEGKALGAKLDVHGTPTVIINGWKLGKPPTEAELDQMVQRVLAGKQPVDAKT